MRKGHKVSFMLAVISIVCLLIYTAEILHYGVVIWWMLPIGAMCGVMTAVINYRIYKNPSLESQREVLGIKIFMGLRNK